MLDEAREALQASKHADTANAIMNRTAAGPHNPSELAFIAIDHDMFDAATEQEIEFPRPAYG